METQTATISNEQLMIFKEILLAKIMDEFAIKHLSGNLMDTIETEYSEDGVKVIIPAKTYNMLLYQTKGVIMHTSHGSYASKIDEEGTHFYVYPHGTRKGAKLIHPNNHKGWVDKVIKEAIQDWLGQLDRMEGKVVEQ